jgi:hypothetical protein
MKIHQNTGLLCGIKTYVLVIEFQSGFPGSDFRNFYPYLSKGVRQLSENVGATSKL